MTALKAEFLGTWSFPILVIAALLVALLMVALCRKDHVRAALWVRSFGFFLEAGDERRKR